MNEELRSDAKLLQEYESTFDNEEKIVHSLKLSADSFVLDVGVVNFDSLSFPDPIVKGRKETYLGLTKSISELGILSPVHVMVSEGYSDWKESEEGKKYLQTGEGEDYDGSKYIVLKGFRRIWAGYKNGLKRCNAVIWDFKDKESGSDLALILHLVLSRQQKRSWSEVWYLYGILSMQSSFSASMMEYLLQLEPGDASKLYDVMTRDYQDIKDDLLSNKKSLTQCYNQLQKYLKEENTLEKEDNKGISEIDQADGIVDKSEKDYLSDDEVKEILGMEGDFDGELSDDDFDELMGNNMEDYKQSAGERHPLDPALRAAVLQRDGYCCQITGRGRGLPANIALSILNVHHKIPVHAGGSDSMDNLITVSLDCHTLIHIIERNNGKLGMSKEQYESLSIEEQTFIKGVMKIARIAVEANRRLGRTHKDIMKDTADSVRFKMPGAVQKENIDAIMSTRS